MGDSEHKKTDLISSSQEGNTVLDGDDIDTLLTVPKQITCQSGEASLVHIYPTGPLMGTRYTLDEKIIVIGRDPGCDIQLDHASVSRRHAEIRTGSTGKHYVVDLKSTNGTYINDNKATIRTLKDGDNLRIGDFIFRYLSGSNVEAQYHEEIYRLTIIDALTGVHNKRYFLEYLERELARSARYDRYLSLVMLDLDHFKSINGRFGHLGGDYTLREVASVLKNAVRREELFARYGGEEFAIILPETDHEGAMSMAERLRQLIEAHPFQFDENRFHVTISLGVATTKGDASMTPNELIRRADEKLFQAKNAGRNRVEG
ncbi:MAG: GGDEF domain-containing protein [Gemmatales bacterium]|nr:MAG: GGDEF domain-containing protein [Gemmatales bacterium]